QLRPRRLRGRRHLRGLPPPRGARLRDQPPAARRPHGLRPVAGQDLGGAAPAGRRAHPARAVAVDAQHGGVVSSTLDDWRAGGGWFEWRGHRIFTRVEGSGDPLLLVHGFPTASWDWSRVWSALTARFRVITLDLIGFGLSAKPQSFDYTVLAYADLCAAV